MSYAIHVRVIQSKPTQWYSIVEKTVWHFANGGTWREVDGEQTLTMGDSGTSGMLRFTSPQGDYFLVALGVHNYKRWCDIVVDAKASDTAVKLHPPYYDGNGNEMLWKQLAMLEKTSSKGVHIKVEYYKEDNKTFWATITIS